MAYVISFFSSSMQMAQNSRSENFTQKITRNIFQVVYKSCLFRLSIHFPSWIKNKIVLFWLAGTDVQSAGLVTILWLLETIWIKPLVALYGIVHKKSLFLAIIKWINVYVFQKIYDFSKIYDFFNAWKVTPISQVCREPGQKNILLKTNHFFKKSMFEMNLIICKLKIKFL